MPRFIAGVGVALNAQVVTAAVAANAPAINAPTVETYTGPLAVGGVGSTVKLTLNGVDYVQEYAASAAITAGLLAVVCANGTQDKWAFTVQNAAVGDQNVIVNIPSDPLSPFTIPITGGDSAAVSAGKIRAGLAGATVYTVGGGGSAILLTKAVAGAVVTGPSMASLGNQTYTTTNSVPGRAGQTAWTVTAPTAAITIAHAVAGATTDTVTSAVTGTLTLTLTKSIVGYDALTATAGASLATCRAVGGTVRAKLNAGTSYDLEVYTYQTSTGWAKDLTFGTKTVAATGTYNWTPSGAQAYARVSNFVGGASATVTLETPS